MRAHNRHIKHLTGENVGSSDTARDHRRTCTVDSRIRPLGTAKPEFHDTAVSGSKYNTGGFRCNQGLMVNDVQDRSFHKLSFHDRSDYLEKRLLREDYAAFRNRINASGKMITA